MTTVGNYTAEEAQVIGFATNFEGGDDFEFTADAEISRNETVSLDCENIFPVYVGDLTLEKVVEKAYENDTVDSNQEFAFTITLTPDNGVLNVLREFTYTMQINGGAAVSKKLIFAAGSTSATINVTLKAGETVSFIGLPVGAYAITETEVEGFTTSSTGASGKIMTSEPASAVFTNTLDRSTGSLKFIKIVDNKTNENLGPYDFIFNVTMPEGTKYADYADSFTTIPEGISINAIPGEENKFQITVHFDQIVPGNGNRAEVTLVGAPSGQYSVTEADVPGFGASWSTEDATVTVVKGRTAEITCTNTYPINNGDLTIVKKLAAASGEAQTFVFNVTKVGGATMRVTVTVPADSTTASVKIEGLELGTYTVTEDTGWSWRYTLTNVNPQGNVTLSATSPEATKTFTNTYSENKWLNHKTSVKNIFKADGSIVAK